MHASLTSFCVNCWTRSLTAPHIPVAQHQCTCWLQDHIAQENQRLDLEQAFWAKEIVVKIQYKYCPNLTIIDTPGNIGRQKVEQRPYTAVKSQVIIDA